MTTVYITRNVSKVYLVTEIPTGSSRDTLLFVSPLRAEAERFRARYLSARPTTHTKG